MRTANIGNSQLTYPEQLVWKQDSNTIKVEGENNIGAKIIIQNPALDSYTLEYYSDQDTLIFFLDDAIRALYDDNIGAWRCNVSIYSGNTQIGSTFNFTYNVLNGKSFISRSHGISSTIYLYDPSELVKVQVYSPQQGEAVCGQYGYYLYYGLNQFNLTGPIRYEGEYQLCFRDSSQTPAFVNVSGVNPISPTESEVCFNILAPTLVNETHGGDVFDENKLIYPICHKIIYQGHCDDYNFGEISYTDLDGMRRYLGGKVIEENDDVKTESYFTSTTDIYNQVPNRYIISHEKTVKVVFNDIDKNAYPHDLLYSQALEYKTWDGQWKPCALKTNKFTRKDEDYYDIELEIIISQ